MVLKVPDERLTAFVKALGLQPSLVRRVIIDIPLDDAVKVYVEGYADDAAFEMIDVARHIMEGAEIVKARDA